MNYKNIQLRMSEALNEKVDSCARRTEETKAEVLRLALEIGIDSMLRSPKKPDEVYQDYVRSCNPGLK